ncbi:MAG: MBL fold metallo-hydrolase, partial [Bacteroidota bacterium]
MKIQHRAAGVTLFESALFRTITTVIEGEDFVLVVDPNWLPEEVAEIAVYANRVGKGKARFLLFTHSDYDHIIGYGAFPNWKTIASKQFVENPEAAAQLQQAKDWDDEYYIRRTYQLVYPKIDHVIAGKGKGMQLGADTQALFYQAAGHNYDGIATFLPTRGILIVGDYLSNIEFPYVYHSFEEYGNTLWKLEKIITSGKVKLLITGHGDATRELSEMVLRLQEAKDYLTELEASVRSGTTFDLDRLLQRYTFPGIMRKFHKKNVAL